MKRGTLALALTATIAAAACKPSPPVPSKHAGAKVVKLCDNKTTVQVPDDTSAGIQSADHRKVRRRHLDGAPIPGPLN